MSDSSDSSFVETVAGLALKNGTSTVTLTLNEPLPGLPTNVPAILNKETGELKSVIDIFERHRTHPARKTGTARVTTLESFIELTARHATQDSVIFADGNWKNPSLTSVIDYHAQNDIELKLFGDAAFGKHRIHYAFHLSDPWKEWIAQNGNQMEQGEFAAWIEDHIAELSSPDGEETEYYQKVFGFKVAYPNELQALSRGLAIRVETNVKTSTVLQTGEGEIVWEEEHKDSQGNRFVVPGLFILQIEPFFMGDRCRIPVRLRYRVRAGKTFWSFHIHRPDIHITEQIRRDLENAAATLGLPAYQGTPEMTGS
jgi:uncharacterized protein YfdQ (DUF2303 family)